MFGKISFDQLTITDGEDHSQACLALNFKDGQYLHDFRTKLVDMQH